MCTCMCRGVGVGVGVSVGVGAYAFVCEYMCVCVCVERETSNILIGDTERTIQQMGVSNCPGWKSDSKCLDGQKDGDGDEYQLSAFKLWHSQQEAARRNKCGSTLPRQHNFL